MADLLDRLSHLSEDMTPPRPSISVHAFASSVVMYATGNFTASEMVDTYDLQGDEITQANQVRAVIDSKATPLDKIIYVNKVVAVTILIGSPHKPTVENPIPNPYWIDSNTLNKARIATDLEIT